MSIRSRSGTHLSSRIVPATGWEAILPWYDPLVAFTTREHAFKSHMLGQAKLAAGARVLDVGCGSGTLALEASRQNPESTILALDADRRIILQALRKPAQSTAVQWLLGSALAIPAQDGSFDAVLSSLVFHHLNPSGKRKALAEISRVLRPGGQLILVDFCKPTSLFAHLRFLLVRMVDGWQQTTCNVQGRLPELIQRAGLTEVRATLSLATLLGTIRCFCAKKRTE